MKHFCFRDTISGEEFIVGADTLEEAKAEARGIARRFKYLCELTELEAEMSGLDEY